MTIRSQTPSCSFDRHRSRALKGQWVVEKSELVFFGELDQLLPSPGKPFGKYVRVFDSGLVEQMVFAQLVADDPAVALGTVTLVNNAVSINQALSKYSFGMGKIADYFDLIVPQTG